MDDKRMLLWLIFSKTGDVQDYLRYKFFKKDLLNAEVGEELGIDKNHGDSLKDDSLR